MHFPAWTAAERALVVFWVLALAFEVIHRRIVTIVMSEFDSRCKVDLGVPPN